LQVIWNLLSNAVKFTPQGGEVEVRLTHQDAQVKIEVQDTGQGINPEFVPYVFDRFRQADSTSTRMFGGLGLGLAIVRNLVELHGGTVCAESVGAGQGAIFTILLPPERQAADVVKEKSDLALDHETLAASPQSNALEGLQILVVDDELETLDLLTSILSQHGARVTAVASTSAALKSLEHWRPDLLVSDIGM